MKKLFNLFLASTLLFGLVSCGNTVEESSQPELPPPTVYTIVYYHAYEDCAGLIADSVKASSGLEFQTVKYEKKMTLPENAIIVGEISDGVSTSLSKELAERDYKIERLGSYIYCCGGSADAVAEAAKYISSELVGERGIELEDGFKYVYDYPYAIEDAKINGIPLSDFTVLYAVTRDEAKYKDVANDFKKYLQENGNVRLRVYEYGKKETENEIAIGVSADSGSYDYNDYKITVSGSKISVTGGNACAVWHGCMALADAIAASDGRNLTDTVIDGKCDLIKVSCVGDSITEGGTSSDIHEYNYPVYLQRMLGYDYLVKNHGISGYSTVFTDEYSYSKSRQYADAKAFAPDVVIFMLGTNDCNPGQAYKNWDDGTREVKYREDTLKYLNAFRSINSDVQIFMCIPPTLCYSTVWPWEAWAANIEAHTSILNREIAEEENLPIVDMFTWSKEHPEVFPDGLHPRDQSYKTYAQRVYDEIINEIIKP